MAVEQIHRPNDAVIEEDVTTVDGNGVFQVVKTEHSTSSSSFLRGEAAAMTATLKPCRAFLLKMKNDFLSRYKGKTESVNLFNIKMELMRK